MKASAGTLAAAVGLSLALWLFFYALTPQTPLTGAETLVVVGASLVIVLFARWAWSRLRKTRGTNGQNS